MDAIREEDIHRMVEYHSNPKNFATRPFQIASGLTPAAQYASNAIPIPSWMHSHLFLQLASTSSTATATLRSDDADSVISVASKLGSIASIAEAVSIITDAIRSKLSKLSKPLSISVENIDGGKSVSSNGIDSLVAMEFRTWLAKVIAADIPLLEILCTMPIAGTAGLSMKVAMASKLVPEALKTEDKILQHH
ncbi:conserved hypothetical protein [Coccidioides posadasii C735 delta SOWgp]|uniref:Carrier domain-containing protein n=1 Tax=Coccidioides posadasii (strain C735) TaxID=222929 RepID=C5PGL2_COCP7|nr:conserved hypothetical protein [Coccidioides posadasii C735 delta SOWgp]EER23665.1 conserved hypothetical protein [Coccidioides posadasii C735 delta SOWgp]|eukprot:XP_003065810.1 conserved hypothetical protein [Coccidioides posadasii C735 delta SOWgp]